MGVETPNRMCMDWWIVDGLIVDGLISLSHSLSHSHSHSLSHSHTLIHEGGGASRRLHTGAGAFGARPPLWIPSWMRLWLRVWLWL